MIAELEQHWQVCQAVHALVQEEHACLAAGRLPDPASGERKRTLLTQLETSLAGLRQASRTISSADRPRAAELKRQATQKIQQILLLDKENEKLLLGLTLATGQPPPTRPNAARLNSLYGKY